MRERVEREKKNSDYRKYSKHSGSSSSSNGRRIRHRNVHHMGLVTLFFSELDLCAEKYVIIVVVVCLGDDSKKKRKKGSVDSRAVNDHCFGAYL